MTPDGVTSISGSSASSTVSEHPEKVRVSRKKREKEEKEGKERKREHEADKITLSSQAQSDTEKKPTEEKETLEENCPLSRPISIDIKV